MLARELAIVVAGVATIAWLVGIVWRSIARRSYARSRPAALERQRYHEALRRIAASDYTPRRHERNGKDRP